MVCSASHTTFDLPESGYLETLSMFLSIGDEQRFFKQCGLKSRTDILLTTVLDKESSEENNSAKGTY